MTAYDALVDRTARHRAALAAYDEVIAAGRADRNGWLARYYEEERGKAAARLAALEAELAARPAPGPEERAFLDQLAAAGDDLTTRLVYADWLDEHDRPAEADRQRNWAAVRAARDWLRAFARRINYRAYARDAAGGVFLDPETGHEVYDESADGGPHTFGDVVEAGYRALTGEGYTFGSDAGADFFRGGQQNREEFFRNWCLYTGEAVPQAVVDDPPFSCAC